MNQSSHFKRNAELLYILDHIAFVMQQEYMKLIFSLYGYL